MKHLKNWDNKTWLSSSRYLASLIKFLNKKIRFNNQTTILDIGCGRGKLIGALSNKYHLKNLPIGIDIVKHKITDKKIKFINTSAVNYLKKTKLKFDLILFKQSIHFFKLSEIKTLIFNAQRILNKDGKIIILSLDTKRNEWPKFKSFRLKLSKSLKKDEKIISLVKSILKEFKISNFNFRVILMKSIYIKMLNNRFTSCLLDLSANDLNKGIKEINGTYNAKINFIDRLMCVEYKKK